MRDLAVRTQTSELSERDALKETIKGEMMEEFNYTLRSLREMSMSNHHLVLAVMDAVGEIKRKQEDMSTTPGSMSYQFDDRSRDGSSFNWTSPKHAEKKPDTTKSIKTLLSALEGMRHNIRANPSLVLHLNQSSSDDEDDNDGSSEQRDQPVERITQKNIADYNLATTLIKKAQTHQTGPEQSIVQFGRKSTGTSLSLVHSSSELSRIEHEYDAPAATYESRASIRQKEYESMMQQQQQQQQQHRQHQERSYSQPAAVVPIAQSEQHIVPNTPVSPSMLSSPSMSEEVEAQTQFKRGKRITRKRKKKKSKRRGRMASWFGSLIPGMSSNNSLGSKVSSSFSSAGDTDCSPEEQRETTKSSVSGHYSQRHTSYPDDVATHNTAVVAQPRVLYDIVEEDEVFSVGSSPDNNVKPKNDDTLQVQSMMSPIAQALSDLADECRNFKDSFAAKLMIIEKQRSMSEYGEEKTMLTSPKNSNTSSAVLNKTSLMSRSRSDVSIKKVITVPSKHSIGSGREDEGQYMEGRDDAESCSDGRGMCRKSSSKSRASTVPMYKQGQNGKKSFERHATTTRSTGTGTGRVNEKQQQPNDEVSLTDSEIQLMYSDAVVDPVAANQSTSNTQPALGELRFVTSNPSVLTAVRSGNNSVAGTSKYRFEDEANGREDRDNANGTTLDADAQAAMLDRMNLSNEDIKDVASIVQVMSELVAEAKEYMSSGPDESKKHNEVTFNLDDNTRPVRSRSMTVGSIHDKIDVSSLPSRSQSLHINPNAQIVDEVYGRQPPASAPAKSSKLVSSGTQTKHCRLPMSPKNPYSSPDVDVGKTVASPKATSKSPKKSKQSDSSSPRRSNAKHSFNANTNALLDDESMMQKQEVDQDDDTVSENHDSTCDEHDEHQTSKSFFSCFSCM